MLFSIGKRVEISGGKQYQITAGDAASCHEYSGRRWSALKYTDLNTLLQSEPEAKRYYDTLSDYVREQISTRHAGVNSLASLKNYAENLTRGDD